MRCNAWENYIQWKKAFQNLDMMNQIRRGTVGNAGIKESSTEDKINKEVQLIWTTNWLQRFHYEEWTF